MGFFSHRPHPDGPRSPPRIRQPGPAHAHAPDSDRPVGGGTPCPARSPDNDVPPAIPTNDGPPGGSLRYNIVPTHEGERTTAGIPSTDRAADGNKPGLAFAADRDHAEPRPRELPLPMVQSRCGALYSTPGRFLCLTSCRLPPVQLNPPASQPPLATSPLSGPHLAAIQTR